MRQGGDAGADAESSPSTASPVVDVTRDPTEAEWNAFVERRPDATVYHLWGWRRVFTQAFGHRSVYLAARTADGIAGVLPLVLFNSWLFGRFAVSLPFVNYGGVVAETDEAAAGLVAEAETVGRDEHLSHLELRHLAARFPRLQAKRHKVAMRLPLPPAADALWQTIDRKVRNQVRKSEKSGLTATIGGAELLPEFYAVFAKNMRDLGTPVYSRKFFSAILAEFPAAARVHVVRKGDLPLAGSITIQWRQGIEVPWASSLREHRDSSPNMLLYWTMLQHAIASGCTVFDFGRSTPNEGTFHFKRQWGAEPTPIAWEYSMLNGRPMPDQSPANPKFRAAIETWKRLPVPVATFLGPAIVRSIP
jgi:FemAB-related protein (PEP-CTERM system-associated)